MKLAAIPAIFFAATACAAPPMDDPNAGIPERGPIDGPCATSGIGDLVGRPATGELGAEVLRRTSARNLRWIQPGQAVTMDYRTDRVNVHLDGGNRVERIDCG